MAKVSSTLSPSKRALSLSMLALLLVLIGVTQARIFGIPGTTLGPTLLQAGPGHDPTVLTTLAAKTSLQVLCKVEKGDAIVNDDPWWLKVHVWDTGMEGFVADFWVECHGARNCAVPLCV